MCSLESPLNWFSPVMNGAIDKIIRHCIFLCECRPTLTTLVSHLPSLSFPITHTHLHLTPSHFPIYTPPPKSPLTDDYSLESQKTVSVRWGIAEGLQRDNSRVETYKRHSSCYMFLQVFFIFYWVLEPRWLSLPGSFSQL